ncbi:hypothetical protein ACWGQ5_47250 [Streptomyces sp. NPDC055722]
MSDSSALRYGTLPDDQLAQVVAAIVDPTGQSEDAVDRARNIIRTVRANTTCLGDMNRGCY